jgi:hypothetical protein
MDLFLRVDGVGTETGAFGAVVETAGCVVKVGAADPPRFEVAGVAPPSVDVVVAGATS